jgi:hypothetical protein
MTDLIVHKINIAHYRLIELTKLADQAKPFYDWIEKHAKIVTGSHKSFNEIILSCTKEQLSVYPQIYQYANRLRCHIRILWYESTNIFKTIS